MPDQQTKVVAAAVLLLVATVLSLALIGAEARLLAWSVAGMVVGLAGALFSG